MFVRTKHVSGHDYVQLVESRWEDGRSRQRVVATLGRLDQLHEVEVRHHRRRYLLRTPLAGAAEKVLQAVGVAIPPPVREQDAPDARTSRRTR